jgi:hypothetical protein
MRRVVVLSTALLALTALSVPQQSTSAEKSTKPGPADPPLRGKYITITWKIGAQAGATTLKNVTLKQLGGRNFLTGEYATEVNEAFAPWKGVRSWIPVDDIVNITEFQDAEQVRKLAPHAPPKPVPATPN